MSSNSTRIILCKVITFASHPPKPGGPG
jgi:hypothetical protein